jgi:hypothetical protein
MLLTPRQSGIARVNLWPKSRMCGSETSRYRRQEYVKSVLALQMELQEMKVYDPKGIQAFASAHTSRDCKDARRRAKNDASAAGSKVHTPRKEMSLRSMSPRKTIGATCA